MMRKIGLTLVPALAALSGCASFVQHERPQSVGEQESGYTYIPIDPLPAMVPGKAECAIPVDKPDEFMLKALPDNAVRVSIQQFDGKGKVQYGPVGGSLENSNYEVVVDYINADVQGQTIWIAKYRETDSGTDKQRIAVPLAAPSKGEDDFRYVVTSSPPEHGTDATSNILPKYYFEKFSLPLYIGVGLRITANVRTLKGGVNINGLGLLGAEAEANNIVGSLTTQTLGINGKPISAALPIQSELNRTTIQNAVTSVGAVKALIYGTETSIKPRVVGLYLPFPGGKQLVNAIISELAQSQVYWYGPCKPKP